MAVITSPNDLSYALRWQGYSQSLPSGGITICNIEAQFGLYSAGKIYVVGNENNVNQALMEYEWNLSMYIPTNTRYMRLYRRNYIENENSYGTIYLNLSTYSGSRSTVDQYSQSTSSAISDIYVQNAPAAGCSLLNIIFMAYD
jgi:hypothetical protein